MTYIIVFIAQESASKIFPLHVLFSCHITYSDNNYIQHTSLQFCKMNKFYIYNKVLIPGYCFNGCQQGIAVSRAVVRRTCLKERLKLFQALCWGKRLCLFLCNINTFNQLPVSEVTSCPATSLTAVRWRNPPWTLSSRRNLRSFYSVLMILSNQNSISFGKSWSSSVNVKR